jgi:hypothetical protein
MRFVTFGGKCRAPGSLSADEVPAVAA